MLERLFRGTYGIVLTPFDEKGGVDYKTLEKYASRIAGSKDICGLVVCGSTGEFSRLSFKENVDLMKTVRKVTGGKQFICGATAGDSYTASKYIEAINDLGADGILIAPPFYFGLEEDEIIAFYDEIIKNNDKKTPIVGYNIPQCTNPVSVKAFEKLLEHDCVKGFKNSWNDMCEITAEIAIRNEKRSDVSMLTGLDACLFGTLSLGGDGLFTAITYLMPEIMNFIYTKFETDREASFACQCGLIELINVVNRFTFPYGYRVLSEALGMPLGYGREKIPASVAERTKKALGEMSFIYNKIKEKYLN